MLFIIVKTNNCRSPEKAVGMIDMQVTYDANITTAVRKVNERLGHSNRKTEEQFLRALHVASRNSLFKKY